MDGISQRYSFLPKKKMVGNIRVQKKGWDGFANEMKGWVSLLLFTLKILLREVSRQYLLIERKFQHTQRLILQVFLSQKYITLCIQDMISRAVMLYCYDIHQEENNTRFIITSVKINIRVFSNHQPLSTVNTKNHTLPS